MPLFSRPALRNAADSERTARVIREDSGTILAKGKTAPHPLTGKWDVFLSHAYLDKDEILGLKLRLQAAGLRVYVDWIDDPGLDRERVNPETAGILKSRIEASSSLMFASSPNATLSRWASWEVGLADGRHGRVAVIPVLDTLQSTEEFKGTEYFGLYPYLVDSGSLWVHRTASRYKGLIDWLAGRDP